MPICPGCERTVPYDQLEAHERYCEGIWGETRDTPLGEESFERLDHRLATFESHIDRRLSDLEATIERGLARIEATENAVTDTK